MDEAQHLINEQVGKLRHLSYEEIKRLISKLSGEVDRKMVAAMEKY